MNLNIQGVVFSVQYEPSTRKTYLRTMKPQYGTSLLSVLQELHDRGYKVKSVNNVITVEGVLQMRLDNYKAPTTALYR